MVQIVTQLVVDASGAKQGVAEFEAAMKRAKDAAVKDGAATATSFDQAQRKWTASLAATDPVMKAQIAMERALASQRKAGDDAVRLGIASQAAANTQLEKVRQQQLALVNTARQANVANDNLAKSFGVVQQQASALSSHLGPLGGILASIGPAGLIIAGGLGAAALGIHAAADAALKLADRAGKLKDFAETTGFTVIELQALEKAGGDVGVSSESITKALEKFSSEMAEVRLQTGGTYEKLLAIDPVMARNVATASSLSQAYEMVSKAIKNTDLARANEIARAFFGRSGIEQTRLMRVVADAQGLKGVIAQLHETDVITAAQAERWDTLGDAIARNMKAAKQNIAAIFADDVLTKTEQFSKWFLVFSRDVKEFGVSEGLQKFFDFFSNPAVQAAIAGALAGGLVAGPAGALVGAGSGAVLGAGLQADESQKVKELEAELVNLIETRDRARISFEKYNLQATHDPTPENVKHAELYEQKLRELEQRIVALNKSPLRVELTTPLTGSPMAGEAARDAAAAAEAQANLAVQTARSYNEMARWMSVIGAAATMAERYELGIKRLDAAKAGGRISEEQYTRAVAAQKEQLELSLGVADMAAISAAKLEQIRQVATKAGLSDEQTRVALMIAAHEAADRFINAWARANPMLAPLKDMLGGLAKDIAAGVAPMEALANQAKRFAENIIDVASKQLTAQLLGGLTSGTSQAASTSTAAGIWEAAGAAFNAQLIAAATQAAGIMGVSATAEASTKVTAATTSSTIQQTAATTSSFTTLSASMAAAVATISSGAVFAGFVEMAAAVWAFATGNWIATLMIAVAALAGIASLFGGSQKAEERRQIQARIQGYKDRQRLAGPEFDEDSLERRLAEFDARARSEIDALPNRGMTDPSWWDRTFRGKRPEKTQELIELEAAHAAERLKIIREWNAKTLAEQEAHQKELHQIIIDAEKSLSTEVISEVQLRLTEIADAGDLLRESLLELGLSAADVDEKVRRAAAALRESFLDDLRRQINELDGKGHLNAIADLFKQIEQARADSALLGGAGADLIEQLFGKKAQDIINEAGLTGDAFRELLEIFPDLTGVVHEATDSIVDMRDELDQAAKSILDYVNNLLAGPQSTLSPQARLSAAQATYASTLSLAQGGNLDALGRITQDSDNLLEAARTMFASSSGYQNIFNQVIADLTGLPAVTESEDPVVVALRDTIAAIQAGTATQALNSALLVIGNNIVAAVDQNGDGFISLQEAANTALANLFDQGDTNHDGLLSALEISKLAIVGAVATNNPSAIATALLPQFNALNTTVDQGLTLLNTTSDQSLTLAEFSAGFPPGLATDAQLMSIFNEIDINGSGTISRLELLLSAEGTTRADLVAAIEAGPEVMAAALIPAFEDIELTGGLSFEEMLDALAGTATDAKLDELLVGLDLNGDGIIQKLELVQNVLAGAIATGSATAIAAALAANFNALNTTMDQGLTLAEFTAGFPPSLASDERLQSIFAELDNNGNGILEKSELIKTATLGVQDRLYDVLASLDTTISRLNTALIYLDTGVGQGNFQSATLDAIRELNVTSTEHLELMKNQLTGTTSIAGAHAYDDRILFNFPVNDTLANTMISALNKIAWNTALIVYNTAYANVALGDFPYLSGGLYGSGGPVHGASHAMGGVNINAEGGEFMFSKWATDRIGLDRLAFANDNGRLPTNVVPFSGGFDAAAVVAELRALRAENKELSRQLQQVVAMSGNHVARTVAETGEKEIEATEEGSKRTAETIRMSARDTQRTAA